MRSSSHRSFCPKTQKRGICPHLDGFGRRQLLPGRVRRERWPRAEFWEAQGLEALETLRKTLTALEERLEEREYLAGGYSLADVAHAGNFVRLCELAEEGRVSLSDYPNARGWMERIKA